MQGSDKEEMAQLEKVTDIADNIMKPANDVVAEQLGKVPFYELDKAATVLAKKGFISAKDFGRTKPDFLVNAFKAAGKVKTACPNRA
jgi:hypothetical protein